MRVVVAALVTFVVGFVIGGYAPRSELERVRGELVRAREQLENSRGDPRTWAAGLGQMLQAGVVANPQRSASRDDVAGTAAPRAAAPDLRVGAEEEDDEESKSGVADGGAAHTPDPERFKHMREAALVRAAQFHARYVEAAGLDEAATAKLDEVIRDMNDDFAREAQRAVRRFDTPGATPRTRDFVDIMLVLGQAYQRADDRLQGLTSPAAREAADRTGFDLTTQVDPGAFEEAMKLVERLPRRRRASEGP